MPKQYTLRGKYFANFKYIVYFKGKGNHNKASALPTELCIMLINVGVRLDHPATNILIGLLSVSQYGLQDHDKLLTPHPNQISVS